MHMCGLIVFKHCKTVCFLSCFLILEMYFLQLELINNPRCLQNVLSIQGRL